MPRSKDTEKPNRDAVTNNVLLLTAKCNLKVPCFIAEALHDKLTCLISPLLMYSMHYNELAVYRASRHRYCLS